MSIIAKYISILIILISTNAIGGIHVVYINGASADDVSVLDQQKTFFDLMHAYGVHGDIKYIPHSIGQQLGGSGNIALCQGSIVNTLMVDNNRIPYSNEYILYYRKLGKIYKNKEHSCLQTTGFISAAELNSRTSSLYEQLKLSLKGGNKLIVVPFSQGNIYLEAALGLLLYNNDISDFSSVKVINIGNISPTSLNGINVTSTGDSFIDIFNHFPKLYTPCINECTAPASASEISSVGGEPTLGHFFHSTYFNKSLKTTQTKTAFPKVIADFLQSAINEFSPLVVSVSSVIPHDVIIRKSQKFSIIGFNLPIDAELNIEFDGCSGIFYITKSEKLHEISCTPQRLGVITLYIADKNYNTLFGAGVYVSPDTAPALFNLLRDATVTDSCISCPPSPYGQPANITDGNQGTARNLGTYSGSFNIFPTSAVNLGRIVLYPSVSPSGTVSYEIQTSTSQTGAAGTWTSHGGKISKTWTDKTPVTVALNSNTTGVRVVKVIVHDSPSWVAFFEVEGYVDGDDSTTLQCTPPQTLQNGVCISPNEPQDSLGTYPRIEHATNSSGEFWLSILTPWTIQGSTSNTFAAGTGVGTVNFDITSDIFKNQDSSDFLFEIQNCNSINKLSVMLHNLPVNVSKYGTNITCTPTQTGLLNIKITQKSTSKILFNIQQMVFAPHSKISNTGSVISINSILGNSNNDWGCTRLNKTGDLFLMNRAGNTLLSDDKKWSAITYSTLINHANSVKYCGRSSWALLSGNNTWPAVMINNNPDIRTSIAGYFESIPHYEGWLFIAGNGQHAVVNDFNGIDYKLGKFALQVGWKYLASAEIDNLYRVRLVSTP